jgi:hypothetical protein
LNPSKADTLHHTKTFHSASGPCLTPHTNQLQAHPLMTQSDNAEIIEHRSDLIDKNMSSENRCGFCSKTTVNAEALLIHMAICLKGKNPSQSIEQDALNSNTEEQSEDNSCAISQKSDNYSSPVEEAQGYHCEICNKKSTTQANLTIHIASKHFRGELEKFCGTAKGTCTLCPKIFKSKQGLLNHLAVQHYILERLLSSNQNLLASEINPLRIKQLSQTHLLKSSNKTKDDITQPAQFNPIYRAQSCSSSKKEIILGKEKASYHSVKLAKNGEENSQTVQTNVTTSQFQTHQYKSTDTIKKTQRPQQHFKTLQSGTSRSNNQSNQIKSPTKNSITHTKEQKHVDKSILPDAVKPSAIKKLILPSNNKMSPITENGLSNKSPTSNRSYHKVMDFKTDQSPKQDSMKLSTSTTNNNDRAGFKRKHSNNSSTYGCHMCSYHCKDINTLKIHIGHQHLKQFLTKRYGNAIGECHICHKILLNEHCLLQHLISVHCVIDHSIPDKSVLLQQGLKNMTVEQSKMSRMERLEPEGEQKIPAAETESCDAITID